MPRLHGVDKFPTGIAIPILYKKSISIPKGKVEYLLTKRKTFLNLALHRFVVIRMCQVVKVGENRMVEMDEAWGGMTSLVDVEALASEMQTVFSNPPPPLPWLPVNFY